MDKIYNFLKRNFFTIFLIFSISLFIFTLNLPQKTKNIFELILLQQTSSDFIIITLYNLFYLLGVLFLIIFIFTNGHPKYVKYSLLSLIFLSLFSVTNLFYLIYSPIKHGYFSLSSILNALFSFILFAPYFLLNFAYLMPRHKTKKAMLIVSTVLISLIVLFNAFLLFLFISNRIFIGENYPHSYFYNIVLLPFLHNIGCLFFHLLAFRDYKVFLKRSEEEATIDFLKINYLGPIIFGLISLFSIKTLYSETITLLDIMFGFLILCFTTLLYLKEKRYVGKLTLSVKIVLLVTTSLIMLMVGLNTEIELNLQIAYFVYLSLFAIYTAALFFSKYENIGWKIFKLVLGGLLIVTSFYILFIYQFTFGGYLLFLATGLFWLPFVKNERVIYTKTFERIVKEKSSHYGDDVVSDKKELSAIYITSILKAFFLPIITLGIYQIIWIYRLIKTHLYLDKHTHEGAAAELLLILFAPFYIFYWLYQKEKKFFYLRKKTGYTFQKHNIYLIFSLSGFVGICLLLFLNDTNEYILAITKKDETDLGFVNNSDFNTGDSQTKHDDKIYARLLNLKKYYDEDLITSEEYERERKEVLRK